MASIGLTLSVIVAAMTICVRIPLAESEAIGVCYGMLGDSLPAPANVIAMYRQYNIGKLRLYRPEAGALDALQGSGIEVMLGVANEDLVGISLVPEAAAEWINIHVKPYLPSVAFKYILAGNEVIPGENACYVAGAIKNLQDALTQDGINDILVSTGVPFSVLGNSYPSSAAAFADSVKEDMVAILQQLARVNAPLMVQVYPYFAYQNDPANVRLEYAQFTAPGPVVIDGDLPYQNLLDAMLDSLYVAMEREGFPSIRLVISETGWPNAGNAGFTSPSLALTYNSNFLDRVRAGTGTPRRPNVPYEGYVFAMFNENLKPAGIEQYWGIFYPNTIPVYPLF
ncbi:hypothetical protein MLD38_006372 [Melastoma candidum]|uniref:Uncharacterized protein n=1 Tax=Melastoma candidum TaxID=119954 RepID=A0ACB9RN75_9MYRT|nr:hypothetical protein MLD38_006372 [Melastoma candidum]